MSGDPTFDVFFSYNRLDQELVNGIWNELSGRGLRSFIDLHSLPKGLPWIPRIEKSIQNSAAAVVFIGSHGPGTFHEAEIQLAVIRQWEPQPPGARPFPIVPVLLPDAKVSEFSAFLKLNTWISLEAGADPARLDELVAALRPEAVAVSPTPHVDLCPYLGLEAFREEHERFFRGRDEFIGKLQKETAVRRLVVITGASGSGKSSVVQAGLLPRLRRIPSGERPWTFLTVKPAADPFQSLAAALCVELTPDIAGLDRIDRIKTVAERLKDHEEAGHYSWPDITQEIARRNPTESRVLLFVDGSRCADAEAK